jgi:hypothetical protein
MTASPIVPETRRRSVCIAVALVLVMVAVLAESKWKSVDSVGLFLKNIS